MAHHLLSTPDILPPFSYPARAAWTNLQGDGIEPYFRFVAMSTLDGLSGQVNLGVRGTLQWSNN